MKLNLMCWLRHYKICSRELLKRPTTIEAYATPHASRIQDPPYFEANPSQARRFDVSPAPETPPRDHLAKEVTSQQRKDALTNKTQRKRKEPGPPILRGNPWPSAPIDVSPVTCSSTVPATRLKVLLDVQSRHEHSVPLVNAESSKEKS